MLDASGSIRDSIDLQQLGEQAVGRLVDIFWPDDDMWYRGMIQSFDSIAQKHLVRYEDGDKELLDLSREKVTLIQGANEMISSNEFSRATRLGRVSSIKGSACKQAMCGKRVPSVKSGFSSFKLRLIGLAAERGDPRNPMTWGKDVSSISQSSTAIVDVIGRRVRVYWRTERKWYPGRVGRYDARARRHWIEYDDGDEYRVNVFSKWVWFEKEQPIGLEAVQGIQKAGKDGRKNSSGAEGEEAASAAAESLKPAAKSTKDSHRRSETGAASGVGKRAACAEETGGKPVAPPAPGPLGSSPLPKRVKHADGDAGRLCKGPEAAVMTREAGTCAAKVNLPGKGLQRLMVGRRAAPVKGTDPALKAGSCLSTSLKAARTAPGMAAMAAENAMRSSTKVGAVRGGGHFGTVQRSIVRTRDWKRGRGGDKAGLNVGSGRAGQGLCNESLSIALVHSQPGGLSRGIEAVSERGDVAVDDGDFNLLAASALADKCLPSEVKSLSSDTSRMVEVKSQSSDTGLSFDLRGQGRRARPLRLSTAGRPPEQAFALDAAGSVAQSISRSAPPVSVASSVVGACESEKGSHRNTKAANGHADASCTQDSRARRRARARADAVGRCGGYGETGKVTKKPSRLPLFLDGTELVGAEFSLLGDYAVGRRVEIYWPDDDGWYTGQVRAFNSRLRRHLIR